MEPSWRGNEESQTCMLASVLCSQTAEDGRYYLVSEDEFLFPAVPLNQVKPAC